MISIGLLAMVVLAMLLVVAATRSRNGCANGIGNGNGNGVGLRTPTRNGALTAGLRRWADAGLLEQEQAAAIGAFEAERRASRTPPRLSPAIESLAYVGGVLVTVGAGMLIGRFWEDMGTVAHLVIVGAASAATMTVGAVIGETEPVTWRLRGFLWALAAVGAGAFAGLVMFEVFDRVGEPVAFSTAATIAAVSAVLWHWRDRPLQHLATFVALVVTIAVGIGWIDDGRPAAWIGLALWLFGAVWAAAAWRRWLPPAIVGFPLGVVLTLVGAGVVGIRYDWLAPVLGVATAVVWTTLGVWSNEVVALAPGVVGIFVFLPWTLGRFFGESLGAPVVVMLSGAVLLGVVVVLWRRRTNGPPVGERWSDHFGRITPHG